jgi:uncharacterized membrane protein YgdD (TMEM256/DUF423 family)
LIRDGFLGQPVNAVSSLAFVLVGALLLRRRPSLGWASMGVGVGSFLFHGPMPAWAEWAHDVSLAVLVVALLAESDPWRVVAAAAMIGIGFALWLDAAEVVTVGLAVIVVAMLATRFRGDRVTKLAAPALLLAIGALVTANSRSGGPLCSPESILQGHALWHVMGAGALWAWARNDDLLVPR